MRAPAPRTLLLTFTVRWYHYAGLAFAVALLSLLTLGLYKPYGLTRTRRALYAGILLGRDPLRYEGTAADLARVTFYPSLAFLALLLVPGALQFMVPWQVAVGLGLIQLMLMVYYQQYLYFLGRQYEVGQIIWRDHPFTLSGSARRYAGTAFTTLWLDALTLGCLGAWRRVRLARLEYGALSFGRHPITLELPVRPLLLPYLAGWAGAMGGWILSGWYFWQQGLGPIFALQAGGAADPAMAGSINPALFAGNGMTGAPDPAVMAEMGTYLHALTLLFLVIPAGLVWQKICLAAYEARWWRTLSAGLRLEGAGLRFDGGSAGLCFLNSSSLLLNMIFANLTRPFTSFARLRYFCRNIVVTGAQAVEPLLSAPVGIQAAQMQSSISSIPSSRDLL